MFREMRRKNQALTEKEIIKILNNGTAGVLAVDGDGGYPYAVPLSYVYHNGKIFFHCAKSGHKLDAIRRNPRVSFCVVGQDRVIPAEYTTYFRSVIAFGKARILESDAEKWPALRLLAQKYYPEARAQEHDEAIRHDYAPVCMVELTVEHMTGKEALELARKKCPPAENFQQPGSSTVEIRKIPEPEKEHYMDLLLLGDEQESMVRRYLSRGELFALYDPDLKGVCVVTCEAPRVYELKNIAVNPVDQGKGYGRALLNFLFGCYGLPGNTLLVGTGDVPSTVGFYEHCGFTRSHIIPNFFTDHYDHPIYEDGVQLRDMLYLKKSWL